MLAVYTTPAAIARLRSRARGRYPHTTTSYIADPTIVVWLTKNIQKRIDAGPVSMIGETNACVESPIPQKYSSVRIGRHCVTIASPATNAVKSHSCSGRLLRHVKCSGSRYQPAYHVEYASTAQPQALRNLASRAVSRHSHPS